MKIALEFLAKLTDSHLEVVDVKSRRIGKVDIMQTSILSVVQVIYIQTL